MACVGKMIQWRFLWNTHVPLKLYIYVSFKGPSFLVAGPFKGLNEHSIQSPP